MTNNGTIQLGGGSAIADGWGQVSNNGTLTGNGTFTASYFNVDATSTVRATGGVLDLVGPYNNAGKTIIDAGASLVLKSANASLPIGSVTLNGALALDYDGASTPFAAVRSAVVAGNATNWTGSALNSSRAASNSHLAIGFAEASTLPGGSFAAVPHDSTSLLVRVTYRGDANLDGIVNALDFNALATHFGAATQNWNDGDFNFDGTVNTQDFTVLAGNFNAVPLSEPALGSLVPEPMAIASLVALTALLRRRRAAGKCWSWKH